MSLLAEGRRWRSSMLYALFLLASVIAEGALSMPRIERFGKDGERREWRRREMQPVPVHRSRMRREFCRFGP